VFGGQLLGQVTVAAAATLPAMSLRSVQVLFARAGDVRRPLEFSVETLHRGRSVGSVRVR
jgi:acyl-CoA thioesterase II